MKKNLALIGMMGCGKSTVAKELAKLMPEFNLVDIDLEIEKSADKKISEIFLRYGEQHFRMLESQKITEYLSGINQILSLGGGAFENPQNRERILKNSKVVYLKATPETIYERIKSEYHRPLLKNISIERIKEILLKRETNYLKSHIIITTDNKTPNQIAHEIIEVFI